RPIDAGSSPMRAAARAIQGRSMGDSSCGQSTGRPLPPQGEGRPQGEGVDLRGRTVILVGSRKEAQAVNDPTRSDIQRALDRYDGVMLEVMGRVRRDFLPGNWQSLGIHPGERALYGPRFGDLAELWFHATEPAIGGYSQIEGLTMVR